MATETIFQWIGVFCIGTSMAISIHYRRKADQKGDTINPAKEEGKVLRGVRVFFGLGMWISTLLYLINPAWMAWAQFNLREWLRWMGAGLLIVSVPLIYWMFSSLGNNITGTVATREKHSLVKGGPYRYIRHPLYTFGALAFSGLVLMSGNWFIAVMAAGGWATLFVRTPIEEKRLLERFGDEYRQYMHSTGRYFPKLPSS